jgi:hypothetical protein
MTDAVWIKRRLIKSYDPFYTTKIYRKGTGSCSRSRHCTRAQRGNKDIQRNRQRYDIQDIFFPAIEKAAVDFRTPSGEQKDWTGSGVVLVADDEEYVVISAAVAGKLGVRGFNRI